MQTCVNLSHATESIGDAWLPQSSPRVRRSNYESWAEFIGAYRDSAGWVFQLPLGRSTQSYSFRGLHTTHNRDNEAYSILRLSLSSGMDERGTLWPNGSDWHSVRAAPLEWANNLATTSGGGQHVKDSYHSSMAVLVVTSFLVLAYSWRHQSRGCNFRSLRRRVGLIIRHRFQFQFQL